MRLFTYISNVVTGRIAHWNDANNSLITAYWKNSESFPAALKIIFRQFIISSSWLVDQLLGPDKGSKRLINKDPLQVTVAQFAAVHAVILESLTATFLQINPALDAASINIDARRPDWAQSK